MVVVPVDRRVPTDGWNFWAVVYLVLLLAAVAVLAAMLSRILKRPAGAASSPAIPPGEPSEGSSPAAPERHDEDSTARPPPSVAMPPANGPTHDEGPKER
jgi:hypothetical protein